MKGKFKAFLIALTSLCLAGSVFLAACGTDGGDNDKNDGGDKEHTQHVYNNDWAYDENNHYHVCTVEGCNEKAYISEHNFGKWTVVTAPTTETKGKEKRTCDTCGYEQTKETDKLPVNPDDGKIITLHGEEQFTASVKEGQTLRYRLLLRTTVDPSVHFCVRSDNPKALFKYGDDEGQEIEFPSGYSFDFTVTTIDGSAAELACETARKTPQGSEDNPFDAVLYDGTDATLYNRFEVKDINDSVSFRYEVKADGFYEVTSSDDLELAGGTGMTPTGGFRVVYYAKAGQTISFGLMLSLNETEPGEYKFTLKKEEGCGAGTKSDPYNVKVGTVYSFLIADGGAERIVVTCKDGTGALVNCTLSSGNGSAGFSYDYDGGLAAKGSLNFPEGEYTSAEVLGAIGSPTFIVTAR